LAQTHKEDCPVPLEIDSPPSISQYLIAIKTNKTAFPKKYVLIGQRELGLPFLFIPSKFQLLKHANCVEHQAYVFIVQGL